MDTDAPPPGSATQPPGSAIPPPGSATQPPGPALLAAGDILPDTARIRPDGHLAIGGCDLVRLAGEHGTPLYVYDRATIVGRLHAIQAALAGGYPGRARVVYAAKAYGAPWLLRLLAGEDAGVDVVSGGELRSAVLADVPRERIVMHGNDKSDDELALALDERVGRIVVDNLEEIGRLGRMAAARGRRQPVLLRVNPGVEAATHPHLATGHAGSKFGLAVAGGGAEAGVRAMLDQPALDLRGLHAHIGSLIADAGPYRATVERLLAFAAGMRDALGWEPHELSPGGGFGVRYTPDDPPVAAAGLAEQVARHVAEVARSHGFDPPDVTLEPGRSIVAAAAVALYTVGSVKRTAGGRTFVAVDGGMADNIRPTAYGARYTALLANRAAKPAEGSYAIAGRFCETGDVLIDSVRLPEPRVGDLVAVPVAGAYQLSMAGNYNLVPRPAVVVVADGSARLVRRREAADDLFACDVPDVEI